MSATPRAACALRRPKPLWDRASGEESNREAIRFCGTCPASMFRDCGNAALDDRGVDRDTVRAGTRLWVASEVRQLRARLGRSVPRVKCRQCGSFFDRETQHASCPDCRGVVAAATVCETLDMLIGLGITYDQIAEHLDISPASVKNIVRGVTAWVPRERADALTSLTATSPTATPAAA